MASLDLTTFGMGAALQFGKKYFDPAKPEYQDLTTIFKLVKEVLPQK